MRMEGSFVEGIHLFNSQKYFEAHEELEDLWLKAEGDRKSFLHGLIQVAAAFHHQRRNNPDGFGSLLEKGCAKLQKFGEEAEGVDLADLRTQLQRWEKHLHQPPTQAVPAPPPPRIKLINELPWG